MSNTPFTDSHNHDAHAPGQMPIVLARLPRVGDESAQQVQQANSAPVQTQTLPPPPTPEGVPHVALRDQIEARTQLHIANTPAEEAAAPATHFVDHKHVASEPNVEPAQTLSMPAVEEARRQTATHSRTRSRQATSASPSRTSSTSSDTFSGKMFQLHARLAPHAGLIVALALIASAGLLYWMIVGPSQTPTAPYETIGSGLLGDEVGAITSTMPEDYRPPFAQPRDAQPGTAPFADAQLSEAQPSVVAEAAPVAKPVASDDQWVTVPLPTSEPIEIPRAQQTQPLSLAVVSEQVVSSQNVTAQTNSSYPTTNNSGSLDFSKLGVVRSTSPSSDAQPVQPELARRPNSSTHR